VPLAVRGGPEQRASAAGPAPLRRQRPPGARVLRRRARPVSAHPAAA